jgi:hypothetical protein
MYVLYGFLTRVKYDAPLLHSAQLLMYVRKPTLSLEEVRDSKSVSPDKTSDVCTKYEPLSQGIWESTSTCLEAGSEEHTHTGRRLEHHATCFWATPVGRMAITVCHAATFLRKYQAYLNIMKPTWCIFHAIYWVSRASKCFEHYFLILRRRYTNGIWYTACVLCQLAAPGLEWDWCHWRH